MTFFVLNVALVGWTLFSKDRFEELKRLRFNCYILSFESVRNIDAGSSFLSDYYSRIYSQKIDPNKFSGKTKEFIRNFRPEMDHLDALIHTTQQYLRLASDYWSKGGFFNLGGSFQAFDFYLKARACSLEIKKQRDELMTPWLKFCSLLKFPPTEKELAHIGKENLNEIRLTDPISCNDEVMAFINHKIAEQHLLVAATTGLPAALLTDVSSQPETTTSTETTISASTETSTNDFYTSDSSGFVSGCGGSEVQ